jgi:hypothetical protein
MVAVRTYRTVKVGVPVVRVLYRVEDGRIVAHQHHAPGCHQADVPALYTLESEETSSVIIRTNCRFESCEPSCRDLRCGLVTWGCLGSS